MAAGQADSAAAPYWKCLAAGLPPLLLGVQFLGASLDWGRPFLSGPTLAPLVQVEFLALHAGLFLGAFGFAPASGAEQRAGQRAILVGLVLFYLLMALGISWRVALEFFLLMLGTNLGLLLTRQQGTVMAQMVARWTIGFVLFLALAILFELPKNLEHWVDAEQVLHVGAAYFLGIAFLDLAGFFLRSVPRFYLTLAKQSRHYGQRNGGEMQRLFASVGRRLPRRLFPRA